MVYITADEEQQKSTDNRSGEMRWQAERRAAMETTVSYWNAKQKSRNLSTSTTASSCSTSVDSSSSMDEEDDEDGSSDGKDVVDRAIIKTNIRGSIVWAGLEPLEFISIFPDWIKRDDVAKINVEVVLLNIIFGISILIDFCLYVYHRMDVVNCLYQ